MFEDVDDKKYLSFRQKSKNMIRTQNTLEALHKHSDEVGLKCSQIYFYQISRHLFEIQAQKDIGKSNLRFGGNGH